MEDTGRKFLEQQVEAADRVFEEAVRAFFKTLDDVDKRFKDALSFRGALQAYTRDSENPYQPAPLVNPVEQFLETRQAGEKKEDSQQSDLTAQRGRARRGENLPSPYSKVGVALRILMAANGQGMKLNEVFLAQSPDAPIQLTKADLYRALPRLVSENKAWRDIHGRYHPGPKPGGADAANGEGQDERLPLAG